MKYIYNENRQYLIEKLMNYKLNKIDEKLLIKHFLKENKTSMLKFLYKNVDEDKQKNLYKKKYSKTILAIIILTLILVVLMFSAYNYLTTSLDNVGKVILALMFLLFHIILLADLILLFYSEILLKNNVINKLRENL